MDSRAGEVFAGLWAVFGVAMLISFLVMILIWIAMYILQAIGVYRMAVRKGLKYPWFAWIPIFCHDYIYAQLIGENLKVNEKEIKSFPLIYALIIWGSGMVISVLVSIPFLGSLFMAVSPLISLAIMVMVYYVKYLFFSMFDKEKAVLYTLLSIIPFVFPILIFILREKAFTDSEGVVVEGTLPSD